MQQIKYTFLKYHSANRVSFLREKANPNHKMRQKIINFVPEIFKLT